MKRKLLLSLILIVIVSAFVFVFTGCQGSAPLQSKLANENLWFDAKLPEQFTYSITHKLTNENLGTYTMTVSQVSANTKIYIGKNGTQNTETNSIYSISNSKDIFHAVSVLVTDGTYSQTTEVYFTKGYVLLASFSKIEKDDSTKIIIAKNIDNDKYYYTTFNNDIKNEGKIKNGKYASSPYYDNVMLYYLARSIPTTTASFTFNVFDISTNSKIKVNSIIDNKDILIGSINCYTVEMTTSDKILGTVNTISCNVAKSKINTYKNVIVRIVEGDFTYTLINNF